MELTVKLIVFSSSIFISFTIAVRSSSSYEPGYCDPVVSPSGLHVQFPFSLKDWQPDRCGYPGFELYCNSRNETILNLPESGEFVVAFINYFSQTVYIIDPGQCLPNRAKNFSLVGSHFLAAPSDNVLFNCSHVPENFSQVQNFVPVRCLAEGIDNTIVAAWPNSVTLPGCRRIGNDSVPLWLLPLHNGEWEKNVTAAFELTWSEPAACGRCEISGGICMYENESGGKIGCSRQSKLTRSAKHALIIAVGVPGLIGIVGLAFYACGLVLTSHHQRRLGFQLPITVLPHEASPAVGLDQTTVASFPMTVLYESRRLPKQTDSTCTICLCEYEPNEVLRSIPECNHYFHADCVDKWLRLKGSCPVCRNFPESLSSGTPQSSTSLSSPSETSIER